MARDISRRTLLTSSAALGAVGALGLVSPARAVSAAGWESVRGARETIDPMYEWDPHADAVTASLYQRDQVGLVNELLASWTRNDQPLPAGLPADLHDFITQARRLPAWTNPEALDDAFDFYQRCGLYLGVLYGVGSGMMSCAIPREARAVYYSAGGADMKDRIAKTASLGYDIGEKEALGPSGAMIVTCVKTRLVHAAVRHLLPQSQHWRGVADERTPISQADVLVTWHSLATFANNKMRAWGVRRSAKDEAAFLHVWQLTASLLGVADQHIPASWEAANEQSRTLVDPILGPTSEGKKLSKILMDLAAEPDRGAISKPMMHAFTRYTLGDQIADWIDIPREPVADRMVAHGWPPFIAFRDTGGRLPIMPPTYWAFDEFLRQAVLFYLGEGKPINITLPHTNNPNYG